MRVTEKINARQFAILVAFSMIGSAILIIPSLIATVARQDAWISALLALFAGLAIVPLYVAHGKRMAGRSFVEYCEDVLGRWLGKVFILVFLTYPFFSITLSLRNIGDFLSTEMLVETPIQFIHIFFFAVVIIGVRLGLEVTARSAELFYPWIMLMLAALIILLLPQMKVINLQPVLEHGLIPIAQASLPVIAFPFAGTVAFLVIYSNVNRPQNAGKAMYIGVLIGGVILLIITILAVAVIGAEQLVRSNYPSYELARRINVANFLQRIEVTIAVVWIVSIFFRMCTLFYTVAVGLAQTFRFRDHRFMTLPLGTIIIPCSIFFVPNSAYLETFNKNIMPFYTLTYGIAMPLFLLIVAWIKGKRLSRG